jgi:hypothetical protein
LEVLDLVSLHLDHHVLLGAEVDELLKLHHVLALVLGVLVALPLELVVSLFEVLVEPDFFLVFLVQLLQK